MSKVDLRVIVGVMILERRGGEGCCLSTAGFESREST
jgi:hypothetical protein